MNSTSQIIYHEDQRFRQWWVWVLVAALPLLAAGALLLAPAEPAEILPGLIAFLVIELALAGLFWILRLEVTLEPGDLVATGTPAGTGRLADGDLIEVEIPGVGVLANPVLQEAE